MMRAMVSGDGVGSIVRRMRDLKNQTEATEEEARQTYAVSRWAPMYRTVLVRQKSIAALVHRFLLLYLYVFGDVFFDLPS